MIQWDTEGIDFDGNSYVVCEQDDSWDFCWRRRCLTCWPWYRVLWRHLSGWARLSWAVAVRWGRGDEGGEG